MTTAPTGRVRLDPATRREQLLDLGVRLLSTRSPGRPVDRDAGRGGRHLARAALPLLRATSRTSTGPCVRKAADDLIRGHRAGPGGRAARAAGPVAGRLRRLRRGELARPTSRWCAAAAGGDEDLQRHLRGGPGRADRPDLRRPATVVLASCSPSRTRPAVRLMVRGWSAMVEDVVISWVRDPRGVSRDDLLTMLAAALPGVLSGAPSAATRATDRGCRSVRLPDRMTEGVTDAQVGPGRGVQRVRRRAASTAAPHGVPALR